MSSPSLSFSSFYEITHINKGKGSLAKLSCLNCYLLQHLPFFIKLPFFTSLNFAAFFTSFSFQNTVQIKLHLVVCLLFSV